MVSLRCKTLVRKELEELGINYAYVGLGTVETLEDLPKEQRTRFNEKLLKSGLELLDDGRSILIERIKNAVIEMVHYNDEIPKTKYSTYLAEKLNHDYTYLASTFSEVTGMTLQHYIINHKVEKVKESLLYDNLSLTEIANKLQYSSASHLSFQFKKMTGLAPSYYKKLKIKRSLNREDL